MITAKTAMILIGKISLFQKTAEEATKERKIHKKAGSLISFANS
jgi:hypothetical protein